jgi:hypothetical protein
VAQFGGSIKNMPEPLRAPTRGRIDYHFKAFELTAVMFMEVKLNLGAPSDSEWTNAIAHVIAECNGQSVQLSLHRYVWNWFLPQLATLIAGNVI